MKKVGSQFGVPASGRTEDLEAKLKDFIKKEVQKVREEFEHQMQEERDKRIKLEGMVITLAEIAIQLQT